MALSQGSRLGRYEIVRQLGAGAMGEVYLARDPQIERTLAIKTIRLDAHDGADLETQTQMRLRFEREAKAAGRLVHPHIVTLFDAGEVDGTFFLAFEFIDGPDLKERARQQPPLTLAEILRIVREAAAALDAAHRVGIIHRDIKPANLLLSSDRGLKIADFGIASMIGQATQLTQTGSIIGTPQYLSPEQVSGEAPLDGRSDLFSLGVVLYELLAGRRPIEEPSMAALLYAIVAREPRPLSELRPDLPPRLVAAVTRLLAKDRDARFPTAASLGAELAAIERQLEGPATLVTSQAPQRQDPPATSQHPVSTTPRRSGLIVWAAVTFLLILSAVLAALSYRGTDRPSAGAAPSTATVAAAPLQSTAPPVEAAPPPAQHSPQRAIESAEPSAAAAEHRIVAAALMIRVLPADAADRAVVKIDGMVRGLAAGSVMTLRPGRHEIEVIASGFEPARLLVESRTDPGAPTEIEVRLDRSTTTAR